MRLLVDAQPLIWHRAGDLRLPEKVRHALADEASELFISEATWWGISLKLSLRKLELLGGVESLREEWIGRGVAQALTEDLTIVGGDPCFAGYPGVKVFW